MAAKLISWIFLGVVIIVRAVEPPKILPFHFLNVEFGAQVVVICGLSKGSPPIKFTWKKNGKRLSPSEDKIEFVTYADVSTLKIKNLEGSDFGNYTCVARNDAGEDSYASQLITKGRNLEQLSLS
ncbi:Down syndrome cell adhesion molecule homolog [Limulus polyphemus]|uniref:Down syndrome cell adhesion molecule homolog n=1 Tax=Limulus polyphemus TaxID=6850 RepID=A0ABM1TNA5_LIMPO|nr:Down syndrome cell adhesion molecule homolog [Limulus polyphemus]